MLGKPYEKLTEAEKTQSREAYEAISSMLEEHRDFNSDEILDSFLKEKAFMFDEIFQEEPKPQDEVLKAGRPEESS